MWDGERKRGKPRTDKERRERHTKLYGTSKLPPRGTGLGKTSQKSKGYTFHEASNV